MIRLLQLLIEGRVEDFKKKYQALPPEVQDTIIKNDPSSNNKYLDWMGKVVTTEPEIDLDILIGDVETFDKYQVVFGDIHKFKTHSDLKQAILSRTKSKKEQTREGAEVLIDNDEFLAVVPKTHDSCGYYGNNTRWCIVGSESYWNDYFYDNTIIIVLDRRNNQKFAVVGREEHGDPTVYDANDHSISYGSFVGYEDEDEDSDKWPEYVHDAINDAMSSDDIDSRKSKHEQELIDEFISNYGLDQVWENYIKAVHREYKLEGEPSIESFKNIVNSYGVTDDDMNTWATSFLYYQSSQGTKEDDLGELSKVDELDSALRDTGEMKRDEDKGTTLEYAVGDYVRANRGISEPLKIIEDAVGENIFDKLYYKGTIDDDLFDALTKYNMKLNSPGQQALPGMTAGKEAIHIRNIQDIIYLFRATGYENRAGYLESVLGLKESMIGYKPLIK